MFCKACRTTCLELSEGENIHVSEGGSGDIFRMNRNI